MTALTAAGLAGARVKGQPEPGGRPVGRRRATRFIESGWGWAFILPTAIGLGVFYIVPAFTTIWFSFSSWGAFGGHEFTGLDNYRHLVTDPDIGYALVNTLLYTLMLLCGIPLAIYLAALINREKLKGKGVFRTLYFLPVVTMPAAIAMVWRLIYNGQFGVLNYALSLVGIQGPFWLQDPRWALLSIGVIGVWSSLGYNMILFSAGLQAIPKELYEVAMIDGATRGQQFRHLTVPLLSPTIFFVTILTIINGFQVFDLIFLMAGRSNPAIDRVQTLVWLFYQDGFYSHNMGYGSVIAVLIFLLTAVFTAIQFSVQRKWVNYV
ncbi:MAG: sugar ABC transporter permease [Propionibacteriaceae bacterium]|jgi:multiple sugar transport system permease protein|nr:sugar ABC transporter permease [Propionibacteriaceae bacterium]